jgi:hypothetical protein
MFSGNVIGWGDTYLGNRQGINLGTGKVLVSLFGVALITDTYQTLIPVKMYSNFSRSLPTSLPINMSVPIAGQVTSVSLRLPKYKVPGDQFEFGKNIPNDCIIQGVSTDVLKIAPANNSYIATKSASIASASSV